MDAPPPRPVLLIGHSHVAAIEQAWRERGEAAFAMRTVEITGRFERLSETVDGEVRLNPETSRLFETVVAETSPALIVAAFWGNQHFPLSTANYPRTFDFVSPDDPALVEDAELVPFDLIERFLCAEFADARLMTAALRSLSSAPLLLLPAPPPLRDFSQLPARTSDRAVDAEIARNGVAPSSLRRKIWLLCEAIYRAGAPDVAVLPTPPGVADAQGFREPAFYSRDWIHANSAWGELVLRQIEAAL